jgi:hypothetical protein
MELPWEITERDATIMILRAELRRRSGRRWSVTGGWGERWGWIHVGAPPAGRGREELARLLGLESLPAEGLTIPPSRPTRIEYVDRARGLRPLGLHRS